MDLSPHIILTVWGYYIRNIRLYILDVIAKLLNSRSIDVGGTFPVNYRK